MAGENKCGVAVGLAARELELGGGQEERHSAELGDPHLEGDARASGGLVEDEPDRPSREKSKLGSPRPLGFQLVGEIEKGLELVTRPRCDAREAPALQLLGDSGHERMLKA